jgi:CRP-like cAMP-binding protein
MPVSLDTFEKMLTVLPVAAYRADQPILSQSTKTGKLLILKKGAVVVIKDAVELATVNEPGAVFGEVSALLDQPHTADIRTVEDSEFYVADAALSIKHPVILLHVAKVLARRIVEANQTLLELNNHVEAGAPHSAMTDAVKKTQEALHVGGTES